MSKSSPSWELALERFRSFNFRAVSRRRTALESCHPNSTTVAVKLSKEPLAYAALTIAAAPAFGDPQLHAAACTASSSESTSQTPSQATTTKRSSLRIGRTLTSGVAVTTSEGFFSWRSPNARDTAR
eukprot:CAMPEP_0185748346 /NCGR_PEP_ID=MMETSP1174-20130828/7026_1 /TAXON_ID=35687 /ORGANISM="Dictyocha speculum, Strain CCMP1381" /LENGTH=126 /DNA_ID=CAMNT_0028423963 /DNA_START=254 /DNA_END=634 /DNA_ORIENTATION=+